MIINSIHPETEIGSVSLTVANLARALLFYKNTLGFQLLRRDSGGHDTALLSADGERPLLVLVGDPEARPRVQRTAGLYHLAILLPTRADLARAFQRLAKARHPLQGASDHGVSEALYLQDLDGNGIEIYADRPRNAWPRRNGELQMVTEPLDIEDLLASLVPGERESEGLPAGTRIGHVHLHVGDLNRAEAFYREVLGFERMQRYGPSAVFLSAGGYHHHIGLNAWAGPNVPPAPPDAIGLRYFTIVLPDQNEIDRMAARLDQAGIAYERQDGALLTRDPAGNGVRLAANHDR